jgi:hypothetical protein
MAEATTEYDRKNVTHQAIRVAMSHPATKQLTAAWSRGKYAAWLYEDTVMSIGYNPERRVLVIVVGSQVKLRKEGDAFLTWRPGDWVERLARIQPEE